LHSCWNTEGKRPLGMDRRGLSNTEINCEEMGLEGVDWMHLSQGSVQWLSVLNTVINLLLQ
jgi:hypothetical protein